MKSTFERNKIKITIGHLLANDFHIGDRIRFWHPSMNPFVLGTINVVPLMKKIKVKNKKVIQKKHFVVAELNDLKKRK